MSIDLKQKNAELKNATPNEVIQWGLAQEGSAIISTNFRPLEAVLLHMLVQHNPNIPVLWVDHGYNTTQTYQFAEQVIKQLNLNVKLYIPKRSAAHRDALYGGIPLPDDQAAHDAFTEEVKLEPFQRGLDDLNPTIWFTALRSEQTAHRASLEKIAPHGSSLLKISPLLDWSETDMNAYLTQHNLPDETTYYDPTKVEAGRECGLHTAHAIMANQS